MAPARRPAGDWAILLTLSLGIHRLLRPGGRAVLIEPVSTGYDLLDLAEAAGFAQLHLELHVDVRTGRRQSLAALTVVKG